MQHEDRVVKIPRNSPCPCGSGKKYKRCCAVTRALPPDENIAALSVDHDTRRVFCITNDILVNQLKREAPLIGESFDLLHTSDLNDLSEILARAMALLFTGYRRCLRDDDELRIVASNLMFNAVHSFMGAVALLRQGFYLQCSILVRSILEQSGTVLHLITSPQDLQSFQNGELKLTSIMRGAKRVLPPFGGLYGFFSKHFVHMSSVHGNPQPLTPYKNHSDELDVNLGFLRTAVWLILVTTEVLFIDISDDRWYWKPHGHGQVQYNPSEETKLWEAKFLSFPEREPSPDGNSAA
jgi:hypothetical protein